MVLRVRCLLCSKILECQRNDTTCLLDHINLEHPNVTLSRISNKFDETDLPLLESQTSAAMTENVGIKSPSNESLQEIFHSSENVNENSEKIIEKKKTNLSSSSNNTNNNTNNNNNNNNNNNKYNNKNNNIKNNTNNCYIDCECQLNKKPSVASKLSTIPETVSTNSSKYQSNLNNNLNFTLQQQTDEELHQFIKSIIAKESAKIKSCTCCYMENGTSSPNGRLTSHDKMEEKIISNGSDTKVLYKRKYKPMKPIKFGQKNKRKLYKTSVEKWRPGSSKITCPECGVTRRPVIRSHADRVSHSSFGAALILTCWPLCFLPCLFPPPIAEYLHCSECNHFLGQYNHKSNKVQPNEESFDEPVCNDACEGCNPLKNDNDSSQKNSPLISE